MTRRLARGSESLDPLELVLWRLWRLELPEAEAEAAEAADALGDLSSMASMACGLRLTLARLARLDAPLHSSEELSVNHHKLPRRRDTSH